MRRVRDEDYLLAIDQICAETGSERARSGQIAKALGIANGTASAMLLCLAKDGLIDHRPYEGAKLTDPGRIRAQQVNRRLRLIEQLLGRLLGWDGQSAADEARRLEPVVSDKLIDALDSFLGFPASTPSVPSGNAIPHKADTLAGPGHRSTPSRSDSTGPSDG